MNSSRAAILALIEASRDGIDSVQIRERLGMTYKDVNNDIKSLWRARLVGSSIRGHGARWFPIDRAAAAQAAARLRPRGMNARRTAIMALIQQSPEGISASQLRERLGLSVDTVSGNLKWLRRAGLVKVTHRSKPALWATSDRAAAVEQAERARTELPPLVGFEEDPHPFIKRLIPAAGAKLLRPRGPRSVWELAA